MGKALKGKSRQSRRQDAISGDVGGAAHSTESNTNRNRNATNESAPSAIIIKLNSIDSNKRLGALIMLNDLLIQNQSRPVALEKLTCSETLSALSVRLLDANSQVVQQTVLCLTTMSRIGREFIEKLGTVGITSAVVRLLSESMLLLSPSSVDHNAPQNTLLHILLELVRVMFVSSAIFVENQGFSVVSLILQHALKLQLHVTVAEFVYELTLADSTICQKLYDGQLHSQLISALHLTPVDVAANDDSRRSVHEVYHDTLLSATLFCVLSSSAQKTRDDIFSHLLQKLVDRIRLRREALTSSSCTSMLVDSAAAPSNSSRPGDTSLDRAVVIKTCTAASKTVMKFYQRLFLVGRNRKGKVARSAVDVDVKGYGKEVLIACSEKFFSNCLFSAVAIVNTVTEEIQVHSSCSADDDVRPVTVLFEACESVLEDISRYCSWIAADPPPPLMPIVTFEVPVARGYVQHLVTIISLLSDMDDVLRSAETVSRGKEEAGCDEGTVDIEEHRRTSRRDNRESLSCSLESALECLSAIVQLTVGDVLCAALDGGDLQQRLSLLLCRCSSSCFESVAISSVMLVGLLAQKDGQYREQHMSGTPTETRLIQPRINALLSNALLRVIETSVSSAEIDGYEQLSLVDAAISAIIDLHTADDPELLQNFTRLNALKKLTECLPYFETAVHAAAAAEDGPGSKDSEKMADSDEDNGDDDDREEMLGDFNDTISNVKSFIEYKTLYCKNC